jgi:hypothetical protein
MKIEEYYVHCVKHIRIFTKKHGIQCISRDQIIDIMNDLECEKKGQRSKHYHGVYAIYPDDSKLCIAEKIGKTYGVKRIFEKFFGDDKFNTGHGVNWLCHLEIDVSDDSSIAIPRRTPRKTRKNRGRDTKPSPPCDTCNLDFCFDGIR